MSENVEITASGKDFEPLTKALSWGEFKELSQEDQVKYLSALVEQYHATASKISESFGIVNGSLYVYLRSKGIDYHFDRSNRMTKEEKARFDQFANITPKATSIDNAERKEPSKRSRKQKGKNQIMNVSLTFQGEFTREMFYNALVDTIPEGAKVIVKIDCEII